ncbi:recombinase RecF [Streptococcus suis]|nr:recombinase RecF [Streptococcus suis]
MRKKFNKKIESVYKSLTEGKNAYGVFHKTLIHLHTPASHDFKLFSDWTENMYRSATNEQLYELFFENKSDIKDKFPFETMLNSVNEVFFFDLKDYLSYLFLAESILENEFELVVVTDHNTTEGVKKLQKAIAILTENNLKFKYYPHILYGVEIIAADKLHIVGIFDDHKKEIVDQWLQENLLSKEEGSYQHSLSIMDFLNENKILNYIAHFNTANILRKEAQLSGAYKKSLLSPDNIRFIGVNNSEFIPGLFNRLYRDYHCSPNFILDNDAHAIDELDKNIMWLKGGKLSFRMFEEALLDYEVSVSIESPKFEAISYIKGIYVQSRNGNRSFLTGDKLKKDKDFFLKFSPSLNCLIGGRGTGKSTLIDMLQFALSQYCDKQSKLEFMCTHANIFILYVFDGDEYIIEVSLPDILQENKESILQYYGQNIEDKFGYHYFFDPLSIKDWTRSRFTNIYKVDKGNYTPVSTNNILDKMFDRRYSVNELVRTADGDKITEFIYDLMLKNKELPKPNYGLRTQTLESFSKKLRELDKYRQFRHEFISEIIDEFNRTQIGKLRICYEQIDSWNAPNFESILFGNRTNLRDFFEGYSVSKQDVVDLFYLVYRELGIEKFFDCITREELPEKYFLFLKEVSDDNLSKRLNSLRNYKDVNSSNFKSAFYSIVKNRHLLNELKRVLKEHVTNERLFLEFNINSKESHKKLNIQYKEVSVLSLGQKVVAMLDFILAYSDYTGDYRPLIIDQPEDNLDNSYIYSHLVQQFRNVKTQRQIILATHNATIVTNSMTDQVIIMESDGVNGWVEAQGYVSERLIKNHIINQLEGGKDSFRHKMSIYETALSK